MRTIEKRRTTNETDVTLSLNLDGEGRSEIDSGNGFFDHMLSLFAKHARFNLTLVCKGDTRVDFHHSAEDIGITLGIAVREALGDKKGIVRYGDTILPMDEALILSAVDISGRGYYAGDFNIRAKRVGEFDVELNDEFWQAFAHNAGIALHICQLAGRNAHHIIEGAFKSVARSLKTAVSVDEKFADDVPSTKGVL